MIVTAIKQQQKRADRFSIFVDNKFAFSLSESGLLESKLTLGKELDNQELSELKQAAVADKIYGKVLYYLSFRPRSQWEISTYLAKNNTPTPLAEKILNKLSKKSLIDDESFAKSWIENRSLLKPISTRRLIYELRSKHIDSELISKILSEEEHDDSSALALAIEKKRRQVRYHDDFKLMQYLARQGYKYEDIKKALAKN